MNVREVPSVFLRPNPKARGHRFGEDYLGISPKKIGRLPSTSSLKKTCLSILVCIKIVRRPLETVMVFQRPRMDLVLEFFTSLVSLSTDNFHPSIKIQQGPRLNGCDGMGASAITG